MIHVSVISETLVFTWWMHYILSYNRPGDIIVVGVSILLLVNFLIAATIAD